MKKGYLIYLIGISGSGKTTIGTALEHKLLKNGTKHLQFIDGDTIREQLGNLFGYTYEERMKCNQVVRVVVQYLINNGISVILAQVAAYEEMRIKMREQFCDRYIEVYVKCSLEECIQRDAKGYYHSKNNVDNLNGLNDIFDIPQNSELVVDSEHENVQSCVNRILSYLEEHHYGI